MRRALRALAVGLVVGVLPASAAAQEAEGRAVAAPADASAIMLVTLLVVGVLILLAGLGYLYRRERGLDWEFQKPEEPHGDEHGVEHAESAHGATGTASGSGASAQRTH
jgi:flagellar basal body-associated protein FliL